MFENLSDRLERSFKILKGEGKITEINVAETQKDALTTPFTHTLLTTSIRQSLTPVAFTPMLQTIMS